MLIKHIGHAEFLIETESGVRIVTDPYDAGCGYPLRKVTADAVLVSHHHHDHDAVENLKGEPRIIDSAGSFTPESGVKITAIRGFMTTRTAASAVKRCCSWLKRKGCGSFTSAISAARWTWNSWRS